MGPSSGTLGFIIVYFFSAALPALNGVYTLGVRCMHGFRVMPCVAKRTKYCTSKILIFFILGMLKLGLKLRLG
jgi:hypothetical protein